MRSNSYYQVLVGARINFPQIVLWPTGPDLGGLQAVGRIEATRLTGDSSTEHLRKLWASLNDDYRPQLIFGTQTT